MGALLKILAYFLIFYYAAKFTFRILGGIIRFGAPKEKVRTNGSKGSGVEVQNRSENPKDFDGGEYVDFEEVD